MRIAVFCSASVKVAPLLLSEIEMLGEQLARDGHVIVYGGANVGAMGALAQGVLSVGGTLIGVVPELDFMQGLVQEGLTEQHVVPTLSSRKEVMIQQADGFLVYPGGLGTLDEALEVLALKSLGSLQKPVVFYNFLHVWSPFLESLQLLVEQGLVRDSLSDLLQVLDNSEQVREYFKNAV